jgi:hypothetical protein
LLAFGILGTLMTFVLPLIELFRRGDGLSDDNFREITEVRKLGGEAHFLSRSPGLLGLIGGRDLISIGIHGKSFGDEALARLVKDYGDHLSGLELTNTGVTDAGLRHLAGMTHLSEPIYRGS